MTKKRICAISIGIVLVIALIVSSVLLFGGNKDKLTNGTEDTTSESLETDDSSSESDEDDKDNADEFPDGDKDSETNVNPDEDKDSESSTTPVDPDDGDDKDSEDTEEPTNPDNGETSDSEDTTEPTNPDDKDDEPEVPVHTCNYNTVKNDSNNHWYVCSCGKTANKAAHNYSNDSDATCDTCGYTRTVVTPEPEKPATIPSVSWTGPGVTLGSLNLTIPTLKDFNDEALTDNTNNTGWAGAVSTDAEQTLSNTLNSVRDAMINAGVISNTTQGFAVEHYQISWSWTSYSVNNDIMLYRNPLDKTYTLTINTPLDEDIFGIRDVAPYSRDVLLAMLTTVSSTPNELYNQLYQDIYGDVCISDTSWTTVGDCKMQYDDANSSLNHYVYKIKAK